MRETKFRQPIWMDGKFAYWHYWGFVKRGEELGISKGTLYQRLKNHPPQIAFNMG